LKDNNNILVNSNVTVICGLVNNKETSYNWRKVHGVLEVVYL